MGTLAVIYLSLLPIRKNLTYIHLHPLHSMATGVLQSLASLDWGTFLTLASAGLVSWHYFRAKKAARLPPGPRGLPLVGNVLDAPTEQHWLKFAELGDVWGEISSLIVFGQTMIIVNSTKVAEDLLDVRGANFSDRPVIQMGGELCGFNNVLALSQYGDRVRKERKLLHQLFGTQAAMAQFTPLLSEEIDQFLRNIAKNPGGFIEEIRHMTAGISLRIAYGYHLCESPERDPLLEMYETVGQNFNRSTAPGAFLVDIMPFLRYLPEWLPGGGFKTTARKWSKHLHGTVDAGLGYVKKQMAAGAAETSFVSTQLEEKCHDDYLIKWAATSIQEGGSDTTAAQIEAFFLAMSLYPDVQRAAQDELDRVIGTDRLPDLSDRAQLPYVNALCKEILRWHVATPISIPHRTREDFIYSRDGDLEPLLIPKNSLIMTNIWKMTHDPERYADPMVFNPSRFIETAAKGSEQDPAQICFGYGRRICPGKLLGDTTVFMACSAILSVFNVSKPQENGVSVEPQVGQTSGTVSHPLPFKCVVEPRDARALGLIRGE
ncbi:Cytochrome P450 [Mycena venus]|uniref:Cytochrome P450 n=1 Tax=Mycena venus TaxID=2733690 RepID=A0A8H6Y8X6_9AGAR|nr:Cytochrome P450 [Mycena venus]